MDSIAGIFIYSLFAYHFNIRVFKQNLPKIHLCQADINLDVPPDLLRSQLKKLNFHISGIKFNFFEEFFHASN